MAPVMAPVMAPRTTFPTTPGEWLYVRLYAGSGAALDRLVTDVLQPLSALPELASARRWFWLRYVDHTGLHLRLRVLGDADQVRAVLGRVESLTPHGTQLRLGVYDPELDVYGGPAGVTVAERRFQDSSLLALRLVREVPAGAPRLAVAAGLVRAAVDRAVEPDRRAGYHRQVASYWGAGAEGVAATTVAAAARAAVPPRGADVERWLAGLVDPPPGVQPAVWLFRLVHLTLNRLGVGPQEEGELAAVLATQDTAGHSPAV